MATWAVEIQTFWPLTMYLSPLRTARVFNCVVLSPVLGSVTAKQDLSRPSMIGGSMRVHCSLVPKTTTGLSPNTFMCTAEAPDMPAPDSEIVRIMIAASVMPSPDPPYSSGMQMPSQPASASARWKSAG